MKDSPFVKKIIHSVVRQKNGLRDHLIMHPLREWFLGLGFALVMLGLGIAFVVSLYLQYNDVAPQAAVVADATQVIYRKSQVLDALEIIDDRRKTYDEIHARLRPTTPAVELPPVETATSSVPETLETEAVTAEESVPEEAPATTTATSSPSVSTQRQVAPVDI